MGSGPGTQGSTTGTTDRDVSGSDPASEENAQLAENCHH